MTSKMSSLSFSHTSIQQLIIDTVKDVQTSASRQLNTAPAPQHRIDVAVIGAEYLSKTAAEITFALLTRGMDAIKDAVDRLATSAASGAQTIDETASKIANLEASLETINGQLDALRASSNAHGDTIRELEKANGIKTVKIASLEGSVETMNGQLDALKASNNGQGDTIRELERTNEIKTINIANLEGSVETLNGQLDALRTSNNAQGDAIRELKVFNEAKTSTIQELKQALKKVEADLIEANKKANAAEQALRTSVDKLPIKSGQEEQRKPIPMTTADSKGYAPANAPKAPAAMTNAQNVWQNRPLVPSRPGSFVEAKSAEENTAQQPGMAKDAGQGTADGKITKQGNSNASTSATQSKAIGEKPSTDPAIPIKGKEIPSQEKAGLPIIHSENTNGNKVDQQKVDQANTDQGKTGQASTSQSTPNENGMPGESVGALPAASKPWIQPLTPARKAAG